MKNFSVKNIVLALLVVFSGLLFYKANYYKSLYEQRKDWSPPTHCDEEDITAINFLLNGESNFFSKARAVVALKENECLEDYPELVTSAQTLVDSERKVVETIYKADVVSIEQIMEFESDGKFVSTLLTFQAKFKEELNAMMDKQLEEMWGVKDRDGW